MSEAPFRSGFVAVAGRTNVGKSTLLNALVGQKLSIVSDKPQTTRNIIRLIRTTQRSQMVFLDAPGLHRSHNRLSEYMDEAALSTLRDVDVILFLVEEDMAIGRGDMRILETLADPPCPVILVINKIDRIKREEVLRKIEMYSSYPQISEIVPVSARKKINIDTLVEVIEKYLPEGEPFFPEDMVTDRSERFFVSEILREKILRMLSDEIPHGVAVEISKMQERGNILDIEAVIYCEKKSHKAIIIGKGGEMLKRIASRARVDMEEMTDMKVNLDVWVKVRDDWREKEYDLKEFGYDQTDEA
ncbi:MAG: GTPase Era [Eubacteriaceae bacterium]|nr:GTPase Era [Eubacteriaceae bacterium]MBR2780895.1 GTPase Era [Eubacteriaceae bacterium]MCR4893193.1 GTPase Era [Eubacteriales bacterium]